MSNYQYTYRHKGKKEECFRCDKPKTYRRYIDLATGKYLPNQYGICDRAIKCGYHLNPYADGYHLKNKTNYPKQDYQPKQEQQREPIYIPPSIFKASLKKYETNRFAKILVRLFGQAKATELIQKYYIGTSKFWEGATVFWIIDDNMNVAGGQVVLFDETGSTYKKKLADGSTFRHTRWVHSALRQGYKRQRQPEPQWLKDYCEYANKFPVPFGLPQIDPAKPIAIVEAPKTAVIASGFLPDYNWLAIGGATYLNNIYRIAPLKGKSITLFPDAGCFEQWSEKAADYSHLAKFVVSDLLERKCAKQGDDLADYLIKMNYQDFQKPTIQPEVNKPEIIINEHGYPTSWD